MSNATERGCRTSAIQLAQKCPFACQKIYRDKTAGFKNLAALLGSMLHNLLEEYGNHCINNRRDTDYFFFDSIIEKHVATLPEILHNDARVIANHMRESANFGSAMNAEAAFVEPRIMVDENLDVTEDSEKKYFSGAIDYYYIEYGGKVAHAFDYKSYRRIASKTELDANLQKAYYPYLIFARHPEVEEVHFYFDFIRYAYVSKPFTYNREEHFNALRDALRAGCEYYYTLIRDTEDHESRPSGFCNLCEVVGLCPSVNNALIKPARITCKEDAIAAARELKAGEKKIGQLKEALQFWTDTNGEVKITETEAYGRQVTETIEIEDVYGLVMALKEAGIKRGALFDCLRVSKSSLEKLIAREKLKIDLMKYGRKKKGTRMVYKDAEAEEEVTTGNESVDS